MSWSSGSGKIVPIFRPTFPSPHVSQLALIHAGKGQETKVEYEMCQPATASPPQEHFPVDAGDVSGFGGRFTHGFREKEIIWMTIAVSCTAHKQISMMD
ncbi:uncharacterized protein ACNS7B_014960 isoform 2-T2 [Menidia menidia]